MLDRIFGPSVLRAANLTPREFGALRGAIGYVGSRLAREQVLRREEDVDRSDAVTLLSLLARFQAEVDSAAPSVRLRPNELEACCAALFWAQRDLERFAGHLRSWQGWSVEDQEVRDWLVSNFPEVRDDAGRAESMSMLLRIVWLTLREQHRAWLGG